MRRGGADYGLYIAYYSRNGPVIAHTFMLIRDVIRSEGIGRLQEPEKVDRDSKVEGDMRLADVWLDDVSNVP